MRTVIVGGGALRPAFLIKTVRCLEPDLVIAADRGTDVLNAAGIRPGLILGDYDSADSATIKSVLFRAREDGVTVLTYPAEKDFSDMEAAVREALRRSSGEIWLLGATGGRLDHLLANILCLGIALKKGVPSFIMDDQNVLFLTDCPVTLEWDRESQNMTVIFRIKCERNSQEEWKDKAGATRPEGGEPGASARRVTFRLSRRPHYLSFLPLGGPVENLRLSGTKYPLDGKKVDGSEPSLTVSNEMAEDEAAVDFDEGMVAVILSDDLQPGMNKNTF